MTHVLLNDLVANYMREISSFSNYAKNRTIPSLGSEEK